MTTPSSEPMIGRELLAPRTATLVGRQVFVRAIQAAIEADATGPNVLCFVGPGGIGKTRLLEEVDTIHGEHERAGTPFRLPPIIDLYHGDHHSPDGLRQAIVAGLDPDEQHFHKYRQQRVEFEEKRRQGVAGHELEMLREKLDGLFRQEYAELANGPRVVLRFDTLEVIEHESDIVQELCQVEDPQTQVRAWLLAQLCFFPNTTTLLAGRHEAHLQEFESELTRAGVGFGVETLDVLTERETYDYLDCMRKQRPELADTFTESVCRRIYKMSGGRPIYLALLTGLLLRGTALNVVFPVDATMPLDAEAVGMRLVESLRALPDRLGDLFYLLIFARKGLDANLLHSPIGMSWSQEDIRVSLEGARDFAIVKARKTEQFFLHDEVYDLFDRHFLRWPARGAYQELVDYYAAQLAAAADPQDVEETKLALLYYMLQVAPKDGYQRYLAWDEDAIAAHDINFDMRLRDEVLRFLDRYAESTSEFYEPWMAEQIDQGKMGRDFAVQWVRRSIARGRYDQASKVAQDVRRSDHPSFDWATVDDPIYKAGLLTAWAEAGLYTGVPENEVRQRLKEAIAYLLPLENSVAGEDRTRAYRILGRAYNNSGYLYRTRGQYHRAIQEYRHALGYFEKAAIEDERADTLNNLAYLLALVGLREEATLKIKLALGIRHHLGLKYPLALSHNTLGLIYTLGGRPDLGETACREALRLCQEIQDNRGIGLAYIALGQALRRRGEQWKDVYDPLPPERAREYYEQAANFLSQARGTFTPSTSASAVDEPLRRWEANNELGSLYTDWGWLDQQAHENTSAALEHYDRSIAFQDEALEIAQHRAFALHQADSFEDLAQVYGDRSVLLGRMPGRAEDARANRQRADDYMTAAEKLIPDDYRLKPGSGFAQHEAPIDLYARSLGRIHLWRGIWAARDLEFSLLPAKELEEARKQAADNIMLAFAYFQQYARQASEVERARQYFIKFLMVSGVTGEWAEDRVRQVENQYKINLRGLASVIPDILVSSA